MTNLHSFYSDRFTDTLGPIRSHALDKPKYGSPIFGKQYAASRYTS